MTQGGLLIPEELMWTFDEHVWRSICEAPRNPARWWPYRPWRKWQCAHEHHRTFIHRYGTWGFELCHDCDHAVKVTMPPVHPMCRCEPVTSGRAEEPVQYDEIDRRRAWPLLTAEERLGATFATEAAADLMTGANPITAPPGRAE